ncbi:allophanate hydrolase [Rhodovulum bhavnagarense]|uniref:Allophanate hydrolase n=1 Tax=Rhodovulum bhavnagarense TaxID=992286 RepID=A0A4R2RF27_9RHOB|nr:allophanate hydrolase [Rhodovulum bhavnagarense]TCP60889.1 allophanate hydrolase [Rhodovulum bhavnagarense]
MLPRMLTLAALRAAYGAGATPMDVVEEVIARRAALADPAVFITPTPDDALRAEARRLMQDGPANRPLFGIPFAVKDNIDVAGLPTTAACPAYAYLPAADAAVVARLRAAGALVIGKTNLDQFATGLNGTRSPHGAPRSVFDPADISGGSSSGSAVAVASGLCAFALGTDTAGSGRVPAAFNNLVGLKPTPGLVPNTGVVPACRSLDVVTVFSGTVPEAAEIRRIMQGEDADDPFSRPALPVPLPVAPRIGVLDGAEREFFGDSDAEALYDAALARAEALGATLVPFDYAPFREAAALLYEGPWVAERLAAIEDFLAEHPEALDPTVREIVQSAQGMSAVETFRGIYRLQALRRAVAPVWDAVDILMLPTAPTSYTVAEMVADPVRLNSRLGRYTNFVNLMGLAAIAVPAGFAASGRPAGVTLVGPGFSDEALVPFAAALHGATASGVGADRAAALPLAPLAGQVPEGWTSLAVVGAHLSGMPLNRELVAGGGVCLRATRTAADYRLFALANTDPPKPGLVRAPGFAGPGIEVELWALPLAGFGAFVSGIPAPLGIGKIALCDGTSASGFLCEAHAVEDARDITAFGGWRSYCMKKQAGPGDW